LARVALSHATITFATNTAYLVIAAHWCACVFGLQAAIHDSPSSTWLGTYGYCQPPTSGGSPRNFIRSAGSSSSVTSLSEVIAAPPSAPTTYPADSGDDPRLIGPHSPVADAWSIECAGLDTVTWYIASLSWSVMIITGTGGTDAYPSSASTPETAVVLVLNLIGVLLWANILASFCSIATNTSVATIDFRRTMDQLAEFCSEEGLPSELCVRLREYFHSRRIVVASQSAHQVIANMSPSLQEEVTQKVHGVWLRKLLFLSGAEPGCLVRIALRMEPRVFAPTDVPEGGRLYVISTGIVLNYDGWNAQGRVLGEGRVWGMESVLFSRDEWKLPSRTRCMTYVETYSVSRQSFTQSLDGWEIALKLARRARCCPRHTRHAYTPHADHHICRRVVS